MMALEQWILYWCVGGFAIGVLIAVLVVRIRRGIIEGINGIRQHISSNHDTLDRKLDDVKDAAVDTAHEVKSRRMEAFAQQLAQEVAAMKKAKDCAPMPPRDPP